VAGRYLDSQARNRAAAFVPAVKKQFNDMPRFSLKDLFASVAFLSLGVAALSVWRFHPFAWQSDRISFVLLAVAGAFLGAGTLAPFKKAEAGALLGLLLPLFMLFVSFLLSAL
jgi:hypothetical protein